MGEMTKQEIQAALERLADEDPVAFMKLIGKVLTDDPDLLEAVNRALVDLQRARKSRKR
jgi:hypothetical protein